MLVLVIIFQVGFSASYCIEKRSVSYNFAARVHPDYQGRGFMRHLAQAKIEELKVEYFKILS